MATHYCTANPCPLCHPVYRLPAQQGGEIAAVAEKSCPLCGVVGDAIAAFNSIHPSAEPRVYHFVNGISTDVTPKPKPDPVTDRIDAIEKQLKLLWDRVTADTPPHDLPLRWDQIDKHEARLDNIDGVLESLCGSLRTDRGNLREASEPEPQASDIGVDIPSTGAEAVYLSESNSHELPFDMLPDPTKGVYRSMFRAAVRYYQAKEPHIRACDTKTMDDVGLITEEVLRGH